ncbi:hypothetical protein PhaeoP71_02903 [Phaeobacter piscinae]|nr:hypothetical protein PhaeoP71_02903 [Phaeobacter piscinae]
MIWRHTEHIDVLTTLEVARLQVIKSDANHNEQNEDGKFWSTNSRRRLG